MFQSLFSAQAQVFQAVTEATLANFSRGMEIANTMARDNLELMSNVSAGVSQPKKAEASPTFFPTPFHYFPNIMKKEEEPSFPLTPADWMKLFTPTSAPIAGALPVASFMEPFLQQQPLNSLPFTVGDGFKSVQQMWPQMSGSSNIKGAMIYFEIPLESITAALSANGFPFFRAK